MNSSIKILKEEITQIPNKLKHSNINLKIVQKSTCYIQKDSSYFHPNLELKKKYILKRF
jgi:hypothetical protein